ncbi:MAG: YhjD/YihY/BrkB family envelope integrity protein [Thermoleophilia bacterium]
MDATREKTGLWHGAVGRGRQWRDRALRVPAVGRSVRAAMTVATALRSDPITLRAAALTYLTVLSIIPLLAVVFSIFQAVVGRSELQHDLERFILENLAVGARENIAPQISRLIHNASGTAIGGVGFVFLVVSAVSLMANVEQAFNHTFHAPRQRSLALRFGIYWCLLTLGPILLALSIVASALVQSTAALEWMGPARRVLLFLAPFVVTWTAFTLLYVIVPATYVKRRAAVLGALVAGTGWEIAKLVYTAVSAQSVRQNAIYGSLSAIPIFLVWVYLSWIILLFGARLAWAAQSMGEGLDESAAKTPAGRELVHARVMLAIARAFHLGHPPPRIRDIAVKTATTEAVVRPALTTLASAGLVREVAGGGWLPARPLDQLTLNDVHRATRGTYTVDAPEPALAELARHLVSAEAAAAKVLDVPFDRLVAHATLDDVSATPPDTHPEDES